VHYSIVILPPSHPDGHSRLFLWEVRSVTEVQVSGTTDSLSEAADLATGALQDLIHEEQT
jgi:hypothetical protein